MSTDGLAEHWSAHFSEPTRALVVPDGCRDLIVRFERGRAPRHSWFDTALADIAADVGYADQAHMSRDVRSWFGCSPRGLGAVPGLAEILAAPAFA